MSPLQLRIVLGDEDKCLLHHIDTINKFRIRNEKDQLTLQLLWNRLEKVTSA